MAKQKKNGANLGFEKQLWAAADKLRGHMDASEYKHVVLGLIFLKYISDAFRAKYKKLEATKETEYTDPEDRDEYAAANVFWVPKEARWEKLEAGAKQPTIGKLIDRVHRDLSDNEIKKISGTYHAWRGEKDAEKYEDIPGFCKSSTIKEIEDHGFVLTPGRYVGAEEVEDDGVPFEEKMDELTARLKEQFAESEKLEEEIKKNLNKLGFPL